MPYNKVLPKKPRDVFRAGPGDWPRWIFSFYGCTFSLTLFYEVVFRRHGGCNSGLPASPRREALLWAGCAAEWLGGAVLVSFTRLITGVPLSGPMTTRPIEMICIYLYEDASLGEWTAYPLRLFRRRPAPPLGRQNWKGGGASGSLRGRGFPCCYFAPASTWLNWNCPFCGLWWLVDQSKRFCKEYYGKMVRRMNWNRPTTHRVQHLPGSFVDYARGDSLSIGPGQEKLGVNRSC
jgi:hypothetical protein